MSAEDDSVGGTVPEVRTELEYTPAWELRDRILDALQVVWDFGQTDGAHHKAWVIDQVVRKLTAAHDEWVEAFEAGEDGPQTYSWDEGIAP